LKGRIIDTALGKKNVDGYLMDYYNRQRPDSFNGGISPVAAEK